MHDQPQARPQDNTPQPQAVPPTLIRAGAKPAEINIGRNTIQTGRVRIVVDENWW